MLRDILVVIHAGSGLVGLVIGLAVFAPPSVPGSRAELRRLYAGCVAVLLGSMVAMIAVDWTGLEVGARAAFLGLTGLGAVIAFRLLRAHHEARTRTRGWQQRYIGHVYFTYVSLWIGFLIVPALNVPFPQIAVPAVVVGVLAVGHVLLERFKQRAIEAAQ